MAHRVVLNLDQVQPYQTRVQGNDIIVTVGAGASQAAAAPSAGPARRRSPLPVADARFAASTSAAAKAVPAG
jgi:type IV pilus assembly protein PilQ